MEKEISIKRNVFLNILRTLLSIIFPLITFPYATRVLQPDGIGKVQFSSSIISYFVMLAGLGIGTYGIREVAKRREDKDELTKVTKELFFINLIPTVLSYILLAIALIFIPKLNAYRSIIIVYSSTILFTTLGIEWLYSGLEHYSYITIRQFCFQLVSLILLFIFVRNQNDTYKYALICVFSNVGANICNFIHSRKYINWHAKITPEAKKHLKPIFILFGMRIAASLYVTLDTTLLGFLTEDKYVGYYEAANKMTRIVISLLTSVPAVMLPRLSFYAEKKDSEAFNSLLENSFYITMMFAIPMTTGLFALSKNVILLISGESFLPAVTIMKVLSLLIISIPLSSFFGNQIFLPLGKEKISLYAMLLGAVINVFLSVILIQVWGAFGAAFASLIAETSITLFYLIVALKNKLFKIKIRSLLNYVLASVEMLIILHLANYLPIPMILKTIVVIILGICIYILFLIILRDKLFIDVINQIKNKIRRNKSTGDLK